MSRIPPPTSRSPLKTGLTPAKTRVTAASSPARIRTKSTARSTTPVKPKFVEAESSDASATPALSVKEAIALRRAEAKKAQTKASGSGLDNFVSLEDALPPNNRVEEQEDILGRLSLRETIERARSTGTLNIATRSLPCLPSALFEIHLGMTTDPLKLVPNEPKLPPAEPEDNVRRGGKRDTPAWFEAQDLTVLKAWNNDILEIQHEISLFGSLKTLDLHKNKITSLPKTFADLASLTVLDLSHNQLGSLPENIWTLPELTTLNLSHNLLTSLPFNTPFASSSGRTGPNSYRSTDFFTPAVVRSTTALPKLVVLDVSHNNISSSLIDLSIPAALTKFDLSNNLLGRSDRLLQALGSLSRLRELRLEKSDIGDESLPPDLFGSPPFPSLRLLDLSETNVTLDVARLALRSMKQELNHDFTDEDPSIGVSRVLVGKKVVKERWELELERRAQSRVANATDLGLDWGELTPTKSAPKARPAVSPTTHRQPAKSSPSQTEIVKEAWEIEAEQGLLTEGGKRRARAAAAAAQQQQREQLGTGSPPVTGDSPPPPISAFSLSSPQYYVQNTQTLTLPPSAPAPKGPTHTRSFSLAAPSLASSFSPPLDASRSTNLALPAPTLPLSIIVSQPFADTLRVLNLANRRLDRAFMVPALPDGPVGYLPKLEELNLEGCNLTDLVTVQRSIDSTSGTTTPPRSNEPIISTLTKLFPSLRTLNLSYNSLTNTSVTADTLSDLVLQSPHRNGLRHLRLRGNRISDLAGFQSLAEAFKGNREVVGWKLEELDLRDNEIGKLPPELGLLPLEVFLVDGNTFRVPQRRVWEREGTKGLLSWLRGRIE